MMNNNVLAFSKKRLSSLRILEFFGQMITVIAAAFFCLGNV